MDDFSFLTGGIGDLNGDGKVSFNEYLNEEHDRKLISESHGGYRSKSGNSHSAANDLNGRQLIMFFTLVAVALALVFFIHKGYTVLDCDIRDTVRSAAALLDMVISCSALVYYFRCCLKNK